MKIYFLKDEYGEIYTGHYASSTKGLAALAKQALTEYFPTVSVVDIQVRLADDQIDVEYVPGEGPEMEFMTFHIVQPVNINAEVHV